MELIQEPIKGNSTLKSTAVIVLLLAGLTALEIIAPFKQAAYAHTFTGDESASFLSIIKIMQAEADLVQSNLVSNLTMAQDHAKAVVAVLNGNHTFGVLPDEVSEKNERLATNLGNAANSLQAVVMSEPGPTQADVKMRVDNLNASLKEAVAVRVPKDHLSNFTVNGEVTRNLVNETLRQYGNALGNSGGIGENASALANSDAAPSQNSVVNMSAYQSAQALASQVQGMVTQTKSLIPANTTSPITFTIAKVVNDLSQLKNIIDTKSPYSNAADLIEKILYPNLDATFHLK
ncbi:MAG: hypothetical protein WA364_26295 [Candidatus Nitrosopolaris sp.]